MHCLQKSIWQRKRERRSKQHLTCLSKRKSSQCNKSNMWRKKCFVQSVGLKTSSGKSMIYYSLPIVYPSATVFVITALVSIIKEQTKRLCKIGFMPKHCDKVENMDCHWAPPLLLPNIFVWRNLIWCSGKSKHDDLKAYKLG